MTDGHRSISTPVSSASASAITDVEATYHAVIFCYPLLPLASVLFCVIALVFFDDSFFGILSYVWYGVIGITALLTVFSTIHYLIRRSLHRQFHYFLILPLILSICAAIIACIVPYHHRKAGFTPLTTWFTWFVSLPLAVISLAFAIASSIIVFIDIRKTRLHQLSTPVTATTTHQSEPVSVSVTPSDNNV